MGRALGDRAPGIARARARQIELVFSCAATTREGSFVDDRNERQSAAKIIVVDLPAQTPDGRHGLEFISMDTTCDQQVWSTLSALEHTRFQFHRTLLIRSGTIGQAPIGRRPPIGMEEVARISDGPTE